MLTVRGSGMKRTTVESPPTLSLHAFAQGATHEIANPLSSISMGAEVATLMLERGQIDGVRELIARIVTDCGRCARLLQGLQRFGAGLQPHPRETVAARALFEAATGIFRTERREAKLPVRLDAIDIRVHVDRPAFEQACADLLHNAFDAGAREIRIAIERDAEFVSFIVRDDGSGIAPEILAKVTEPFFSTRRGEGRCGLGLTLLSELAKSHHGELRVAANVPTGAAIELRLPRAAP